MNRRRSTTGASTRSRPTSAPRSTCRRWCSVTRASPLPPASRSPANPADGTREYYGDWLTNAQGEDVVAGIRNTETLAELPDVLPEAGKQLYDIFEVLEQHYRDICDIEFTIEQERLWMLQTRIGKRTARAALKIAVDMVTRDSSSRERRSCGSIPSSSTAAPSAVRRQGRLPGLREGPERVARRGSGRGRVHSR